MRKSHILALVTILAATTALGGYAKFTNSIEKAQKGMSSSDYLVVKHSGGKVV